MSDTLRVKVTTSTGFANAKHVDYLEYSREEWEAMTAEERERDICEIGFSPIDVGACIVDEDDNEIEGV